MRRPCACTRKTCRCPMRPISRCCLCRRSRRSSRRSRPSATADERGGGAIFPHRRRSSERTGRDSPVALGWMEFGGVRPGVRPFEPRPCMTDILMPALSPTMEEGNLTKWHVKVGDKVTSGQVIAEIETDKATMEVEAVDEGVITEILVPEGSEGVKVNALIARLDDGSAPAAKPAPVAAPAPTAPTTPAAAPAPVASAPPPKPAGDRIFASPLAKRLAEQK